MRSPTLALLALTACAHSPFGEVDRSKLPESAEYPDARSVVLSDDELVELGFDERTQVPNALVTRTTRTLSFKASTRESVDEHYNRSFEEVVSLDARVISANGTVALAAKDKARDYPVYWTYALFSNARVRSLPIPAVGPGAVLEERSVIRRTDVRPFMFGFDPAGESPVRRASLTLSMPKGWGVEAIAMQGSEIISLPATETEVNGRRVLTWARTDVPAIPSEPRRPDTATFSQRVFVRLTSWQQGRDGAIVHAPADAKALSAWLWSEVQKLPRDPAVLEATVKDVLKEAPPAPRERARLLYEHAARDVQYCAVEIGYGGWVPHSSVDVQKAHYGDCKDKANYLRELLAVIGIRSRLTLIYSHDGVPHPFVLPVLGGNFNHAILTVDLPDGPVFADPTWRSVPFGTLPHSDVNAPILWVDGENGALGTTPDANPLENLSREHIELAVDEKGDARGTFSLDMHGAQAIDAEQGLLKRTKKIDRLADGLLSLLRTTVSSVKANNQPFSGRVSFTGSVAQERSLTLWPGQPSLVRFAQLVDTDRYEIAEDRRTPYVFDPIGGRDTELVIQLPASMKVRRLPEPVTLENEALRFSLSWSANGRQLKASRQLLIKHRLVGTEALAQQRTLLTSMNAALEAPVLLMPVTP